MTTLRHMPVLNDTCDIVETVSLGFAQDVFEVLTAFDGEQAVSGAREQPYLIDIDLILPEGNGYKVVRCLREDHQEERPATDEATERTTVGQEIESPTRTVASKSNRNVSPARIPLLALALTGSLGLSCAVSPASPTGGQEVRLDAQRAALYWAQFEQRLPRWFKEIDVPVPQVPSRDIVLTQARFIEIALGEADTCWFDPPNRLEIRTDLWESGCVPHEIGHLALKMAGHPCWGEWEHGDEVKKCQNRLK